MFTLSLYEAIKKEPSKKGCMKRYLSKSTKCLLLLETLFFGYHCWFGKYGFVMVRTMNAEYVQLAIEINELTFAIALLEKDIKEWYTHPFYQEKIAREELHMARKDDEVYYIT